MNNFKVFILINLFFFNLFFCAYNNQEYINKDKNLLKKNQKNNNNFLKNNNLILKKRKLSLKEKRFLNKIKLNKTF